MSLKSFFRWTRDNQSRFAANIKSELAKKIDAESVRKMFAELPASDDTNKVSKSGDIMNGILEIDMPAGSGSTIFPLVLKGKYSETSGSRYYWGVGISTLSPLFYFQYQTSLVIGISPSLGIFPANANSNLTLGYKNRPWGNTFTKKLNNGEDIEIPTKAGTLALLSDIEKPDAISKSGGTMTGDLTLGDMGTESTHLQFLRLSGQSQIGGFITDNGQGLTFGSYRGSGSRNSLYAMSNGQTLGFYPLRTDMYPLGNSIYKWSHVYSGKLNNGADIEIPNKGGTLALVSDIEDTLRKHGLIQ